MLATFKVWSSALLLYMEKQLTQGMLAYIDLVFITVHFIVD